MQARGGGATPEELGCFCGGGFGCLSRNQPPQQPRRRQAKQAQQRGARPPTDDGEQQPDQTRNQCFADVAGEVVLGQRLLDPTAVLVGVGDHRRGQWVLGAGAQAAEQQRHQQHAQPCRLAHQQVGDTRQRRAAHQHRCAAPASGGAAGQQLEHGHHPGIGTTQQTDLGVGQGELSLPDRQQNVDHVSEPIMHGMGAATSEQSATARR